MKRIILTTMLMVTVCLATFARTIVAEGKTFTTFGNYRIEVADNPVMLNGKMLDAFIISYDNTDQKVTLAVEKQRKCRKYYVLSDLLSVQYVCNGNYFGVEKLDKELANDGFKTSEKGLNKVEYYYQKVICREVNSDIDNSKLIAAFYPALINNTKTMLSEK